MRGQGPPGSTHVKIHPWQEESKMTKVYAKPRTLKEIIGVRPVEWATEPLTITLDAVTIKQSVPQNQNACAMANACRKATTLFDVLEDVAVKRSRAWLVFGTDDENGRVVKYMIPKALRDQIVEFDATGGFEPGEYQLEPPPPSILGLPSAKRQTSRKGIKNEKQKKVVRSLSLKGIDLRRNTGGFPSVDA